MNIFDIMGPIMIGPSSSHTAGVVRIGNVANKILGGAPQTALVKFHGSFSTTYKGHGSDKAIVAGLLGFATDNQDIKYSLAIAKEKGLNVTFTTVDLENAHPNTIIVEATKDEKSITILGESVGGGNIMIRKINDIDVEFDGRYDTLIVNHKDTPGEVSLVTNVLSVKQINIANMKVCRSQKGGEAIMIIEADGRIDKSLAKSFESLPNIGRVTVLESLNIE